MTENHKQEWRTTYVCYSCRRPKSLPTPSPCADPGCAWKVSVPVTRPA